MLKCIVFVIFECLLGAVIDFVRFRHFLGAVAGPGFQDVFFFPNLYGTGNLDFVSIVVSSRWLEKVPHAKLSSAKIDLTQKVCVDFENN